jgi:excisionase family DNA binding protein
MNPQVKQRFAEYLLEAKDPVAAALLVLADALDKEPIIVETDDNNTVSVKEAAELLKTSSRQVYLMCLTGRLRGRCVGGRVRIPIDEIERYQDAPPSTLLTASVPSLARARKPEVRSDPPSSSVESSRPASCRHVAEPLASHEG